MLVSSPTTGIVLTDLLIADPNGGVKADKLTTIKYAGTTLFNAFIPVCFDANIPDPLSNPCFLIVGINFLPVEAGEDLRVAFLLAIFSSA